MDDTRLPFKLPQASARRPRMADGERPMLSPGPRIGAFPLPPSIIFVSPRPVAASLLTVSPVVARFDTGFDVARLFSERTAR